jgi:nitrogen regulatory protein PII
MKRLIAYVNTKRVHWLVEELQSLGISEIMVTEFFGPSSQISRFEFLCEDHAIESTKAIVHRIGTSANLTDHFVDVQEVDAQAADRLSLGRRISRLQTGE